MTVLLTPEEQALRRERLERAMHPGLTEEEYVAEYAAERERARELYAHLAAMTRDAGGAGAACGLPDRCGDREARWGPLGERLTCKIGAASPWSRQRRDLRDAAFRS